MILPARALVLALEGTLLPDLLGLEPKRQIGTGQIDRGEINIHEHLWYRETNANNNQIIATNANSPSLGLCGITNAENQSNNCYRTLTHRLWDSR